MVSVRPERPAQVIIIGAIEHGPELEQSRISQAVSHVARLFGARSRAAMTASSIEVVFDIPGSLGEPDFNGVQVGTSWPKAEELQVFAAVPSALAAQADPELALLDLVDEAIAEVASAAERRGVPIDVTSFRRDIEWVRRTLVNPSHAGPDPPAQALAPHVGERQTDAAVAASEDGVGFRVRVTTPDEGALKKAFLLEAAIDDRLRSEGIGYVDGNELGAGSFLIFAYGSAEHELIAAIRSTIEAASLESAEIYRLTPDGTSNLESDPKAIGG